MLLDVALCHFTLVCFRKDDATGSMLPLCFFPGIYLRTPCCKIDKLSIDSRMKGMTS